MGDGSSGPEAPTRREYVKYCGAVVTGGLLAGCAGGSDSGSTPQATGTETPTETAIEPTTTAESTATGISDTSYSVTMGPMGTVEFDEVPQTWMGDFGFAADIGVALGQFDGLVGMTSTVWYTGFYDELPGISVDNEGPIPRSSENGEGSAKRPKTSGCSTASELRTSSTATSD